MHFRYGVGRKETIWTSSLYSPEGQNIDLCEGCGQDEEKEIEEKGTNHIPKLLARYQEEMKTP